MEVFMKKSIILILVLFTITLTGCNLPGKTAVNDFKQTAENVKQTASDVKNVASNVKDKVKALENGDSVVGSVKDMLTMGKSMKCTWEDETGSGTTWIKGESVRSDIVQDGEKMGFIYHNNCNWSWGGANREGVEGIKTCFDKDVLEDMKKMGEDMADSFKDKDENNNDDFDMSDITGLEEDTNMKCSPAIISDDKFTPPADVKFTDMTDMMNSFTEGLKGVTENTDLDKMSEDMEKFAKEMEEKYGDMMNK